MEGCRAIGFTLGIPAPSACSASSTDVLVDRAFVERRAQHAAAELGDARRPAGDAPCSRRTTSPTRWPPRRWPAPTASPPGAVRDGLRAFRPDAHRIAQVADGRRRRATSTTPRRPTRTPPRPRWPPTSTVVWIAGGLAKGADVRRAGRRRAPTRLRGVVLHRRRPGADRRGARATRAGCPGRRRRPAPTLGRWTTVVRAAPRARARRATPCCSPRPAPRWTCSPTTPSAATRSRRRSAGSAGGRAAGEHARPPTGAGARRPRRRPRPAPARCRLVGALRVAAHHLLPAPRRDGRCCSCSAWSWCSRPRASTSLARRRLVATRSSSSQAMFAVHRRCRCLVVAVAAAGRGAGSGSPTRSLLGRVAAALLVLVAVVGRQRQRQPELDRRRRPVQLQPSEFAKLALVLVGRRPAGPQASSCSASGSTCWCPPRAGRRARASALVLLGARPRHRAHPRRDRRGAAVRRRRPAAAVRLRRRRRSPAWPSRSSSTSPQPAWAGIDVWLGRDCADHARHRLPAVHGMYALAAGGWFGVGLGASREKWGWLPEAHTDFIFAIIGEELGCSARSPCSLLFGLLGYGRAAGSSTRTDDLFVRIAAGRRHGLDPRPGADQHRRGLGLLPVIGVPLPLVSYGGSALVPTLFALGMLLSFARAEPGCAEALPTRPSARAPLARGAPPASRAAPDARMTSEGRCRVRRSPAAGPPATSSRCSPSPTACAGATRRSRSPRSAPQRAWRPGSSRRAATSCATVPRCRCRAARPATCCGCPAGCGPRSARPPTRHRRDRGRGRRRLRRLRLHARLPRRPPPRRRRSWSTRRTPRPGLANRLGARLHAVRRRRPSPARRCAHAASSGCRCGARSRTLDRAAQPRPRRGRASGSTRPADAAGHRRLAGRPAAQRRRSARARADLRGGRRPGAARRPARQGASTSTAATAGAPPYVVRAYLRPDGPRLRRRRPRRRAAPARTPSCELTAVGLPAVYVPLPIGNGEQRLNAAAVVEAGGGLLVDDADLHRRVGAATSCCPCSPTRTGWRRWPRPPRRSGSADADERLADLVRRGRARRPGVTTRHAALRRSPHPSGARRAARPRAPRRHRRRRHVGHRPDPAGPRRCPVSGTDAKDSPVAGTRCARGARVARRPRRRARRRRRHRRRLVRRSATTTSSCAAARGRGPAGAAPVAGARPLMAGRAGRGRRRQRQDHHHVDARPSRSQRCRRRPVVRHRRRARRARHQRPPRRRRRSSSSRPTRATARSSPTAPTSRSSPTSSPTTSTTTAPLEAVERGLRRLRRRPSTDGGLVVACADDDGRGALAEAARGRRPHGASPTARPRRRPAGRRGAARAASAPGSVLVHDGRRARRSTLAVPGRPQRRSTPRRLPRRRRRARLPTRAVLRRARRRSAAPAAASRCSGEAGGVRVVDDYAHHPTKVAAVVRHGIATSSGRARVAASSCSSRTCTPAPATSRPSSARRSALADEVVVMDVYAAREDPVAGRHRRPWSPTAVRRCPAGARCSSADAWTTPSPALADARPARRPRAHRRGRRRDRPRPRGSLDALRARTGGETR